MLGFLKFYNKQDVLPLAIALENCFKCYSNYFDVNPMSALSLPGLAQKAMFKNYDSTSPLIFSFTDKFKDLSEFFRRSIYGGLVNVYRTHVTTFDQPPPVPKSARYAPNGDPFTFILALDVNAMYLGCQGKEMPTSPGILHVKKENGTYSKNIMCDGQSFKCQQWLCERQAQDNFLNNSDGSRSIIQTKYHRGEIKIPRPRYKNKFWAVDGYAETDQGVKIYEFNGEYWHSGCPHCSDGDVSANWTDKVKDIKMLGYNLEVIWECQFDKLLNSMQNIETPLIPQILKTNQTEIDILNGIKSGRLFGYIICDVQTPDHIAETLTDFPPIIKRAVLTKNHLSEYMKLRVKMEKHDLNNFKRETLIQCFNAKNHLLLTPLANYYMEKGIIISNVRKFIQYIPVKCLTPFVELVTEMRIDAEKNNLPTKGNTAKIFGNSGYGKLCERVSDYSETVLVSNKKSLITKMASPFFKREVFLESEDLSGVHEVVMDQRMVTDDKPVHVGIAILQYSKILMLQFVDFLREFLIPGSFTLVYTG
jgi:hypothetical protein